jgi:hypothetical protein
MKEYRWALQRITLPVAAALLLAGCVKDDCKHTYKIYTPVYKTVTQLRSEVKLLAARPLEHPGKIYIMGNRVYLNEKGKGIHVIDNSNPLQPRNMAFINIPGNIDIAMKNNILYADMHCDLAAFDMSNQGAAPVKKYLANTFPTQAVYTSSFAAGGYSTNPDSIKVIVDWTSRDTTISCDTYNWLRNCPGCGIAFSTVSSVSQPAAGTAGTAGSMARFSTVGDYLYALDTYNMDVIDIADAANPLLVKRQPVNGVAETIYAFNNNLFLGMTTGMSIYSLQNPANPARLSMSIHWRLCDPVIADDKYAYVTLYAGAVCGNAALNQLEVFDISSLQQPALVKTYPLTSPHGLSKDGNLLFICDGKDGLKIFDATDVQDIRLLKHIGGIDTYDVITMNGIAFVVAKDGLYQYDYSHPAATQLLSKLKWSNPLD